MTKSKQDNSHLHRQLIRLGDMMGDSEHHEPGGKWIEKEYKKILKALGIGPKRKNRSASINKFMKKRINDVDCQKCHGKLRQTRSGSMRGQCIECGAKYKLMTFGKK